MAAVAESSLNLAADKGAPGQAQQQQEVSDLRRNFNYPLVKFSDMSDEMKAETVDMVVTAVEKHSGNYEASSKMLKETLDKKYGNSWHVVIGEGFAFEITHEMRNLLYMYSGGLVGILVWKAS